MTTAAPKAPGALAGLTVQQREIVPFAGRGLTNGEIARGMFLSRRTVQTYILHILAKPGAKGRVEVVREALRQGISHSGCAADRANKKRPPQSVVR